MTIRRFFFRLFTLFFHPLLSKGGNVILGTDLTGMKGNNIKMKRTLVKRCKIKFQGEGNTILTGRSSLYNSTIFLRGKGHRLVIEDDCQIFNLRIKIIGENNEVHIGKRSSLDGGNIISGGNDIHIFIGEDCMISEGLDLWSTDTHSITKDGRLLNPPKSIEIGNHVWIGKDVAILKGVNVGNNAIIGMRSVVTKNISPGTLNVGSPSREIQSDIDWSRKNPNNG